MGHPTRTYKAADAPWITDNWITDKPSYTRLCWPENKVLKCRWKPLEQ
jgi:hypothetical protein